MRQTPAITAAGVTVAWVGRSPGTVVDSSFRHPQAPVGAPLARAHAERWVGSLRRECLDRLLIVGRRHLEHVVATYTLHYNQHRPHRSLNQRPPLASTSAVEERARAKSSHSSGFAVATGSAA